MKSFKHSHSPGVGRAHWKQPNSPSPQRNRLCQQPPWRMAVVAKVPGQCARSVEASEAVAVLFIAAKSLTRLGNSRTRSMLCHCGCWSSIVRLALLAGSCGRAIASCCNQNLLMGAAPTLIAVCPSGLTAMPARARDSLKISVSCPEMLRGFRWGLVMRRHVDAGMSTSRTGGTMSVDTRMPCSAVSTVGQALWNIVAEGTAGGPRSSRRT